MCFYTTCSKQIVIHNVKTLARFYTAIMHIHCDKRLGKSSPEHQSGWIPVSNLRVGLPYDRMTYNFSMMYVYLACLWFHNFAFPR